MIRPANTFALGYLPDKATSGEERIIIIIIIMPS
jgi:hypothetical protein